MPLLELFFNVLKVYTSFSKTMKRYERPHLVKGLFNPLPTFSLFDLPGTSPKKRLYEISISEILEHNRIFSSLSSHVLLSIRASE